MAIVLHLQVIRGGQCVAEHQFDLTKKVVRLGRSPTAQVRVDDPGASRVHAALELSPSGVLLVDLGTAAGTLVNGTRASRIALAHGDQITIGETSLIVSLAEGLAYPTAAGGYVPPMPTIERAPMNAPMAPPVAPTPTPTFASPMHTLAMPGMPTSVPGSTPVPGASTQAPSSYAQPLAGAVADPYGENDPLLQKAAQTRRRNNLILGGGLLGGLLLVILFVALSSGGPKPGEPGAEGKPAPAGEAKLDEKKPEPSGSVTDTKEAKPVETKDADPKVRDGNAEAPTSDVTGGAPADAAAAASSAFDAKEPRDEARYLYRRVDSARTLEAMSTALYGRATRAPLLASANPGLKDAQAMIAVGVEVRAPRFVEVQVKAGDTLDAIAAAELGDAKLGARILEANPELKDPAALTVGVKVRIPVLK